MTGIKPIIREAREAVLDGFAHAKDRLHQLTDNMNDHLVDVARQVRDKDKFDDKPDSPNTPDAHRPRDGNSGDDTDGSSREKRRGVDRGDGRDDYGHFVGSGNRPWVDKEKIGLDNVSDRRGVDVIREQVRATIEGHRREGASADQSRYYDGLYKNGDGTYTGVEVKSGSATRDAAQEGFDNAVSKDNPATAILNGEPIKIVEVILETVP